MTTEHHETNSPSVPEGRRGVRWWTLHIGLSLAAVFFMLFGIQLLVAAYGLADPFHFIMTFFSSNLIILISGALLFGFCCRIVEAVRSGSRRPDA